jgi:ribosome-associated protein
MNRRAAPHRGIDVHCGGDAAGAASRPSKTELKRQADALQKLGAELAALGEERLDATPMPDALREAIRTYRRTKSHEGRRRQLQYLGKMMRGDGVDEAALREALAAATLGSARDALALHEAERWRGELIADDAALERWLQSHPDTDAQHLRSLVRAARRDAAGLAPEARQPKSFRELFQFIRPVIQP